MLSLGSALPMGMGEAEASGVRDGSGDAEGEGDGATTDGDGLRSSRNPSAPAAPYAANPVREVPTITTART
jgi:hypothetical protein